MKKIISFILSSALVFSGIVYSAGAAEKNETVKILSVGDSITDGYGTEGSYRKFLYNGLTEAGYSIDMVGPNSSWGDAKYTDADGKEFTYDSAHCGYSGYAIEAYPGRNGIRETIADGNYLEEYKPDIVILQIGTNDIIDNHEISTAGERLNTLVTYILDNISEDSALFVTTVPDLEPNREDVYQWFSNYRHSADWQTQYSDEEAEAAVNSQIVSYNAQVLKVVLDKQRSGVKNIYFGDVHSAVTDTSKQLKDGVHPNDDGYLSMGEYWTGKIIDYLSGKTGTPPSDMPGAEPTPVIPPVPVYGDVNGDDYVNALDVVLLQKYLLGCADISEINMAGADLNGDSVVNVADLVKLKNDVIING